MSVAHVVAPIAVTFVVLIGTASDAIGGCAESVDVLRPLETEASATTQRLIDSYFKFANEVEFRFVKFKDIELRGYEPRVDAMRYSYTYRCDNMCPQLAERLSDRLRTARLADGVCPWITGAVIFRGPNQDEIARILIGGNGHCVVMSDKTYLLGPHADLSYLYEVSESIF